MRVSGYSYAWTHLQKPTRRDVLATGSYDGTIKLWNVARMEAIDTLKPNSGVIYSIAWPHQQGKEAQIM